MENRSFIISVGVGLAALMLNGQRVTNNAIERLDTRTNNSIERLQDSVGGLRERISVMETSMTHIETRLNRIENILGYSKATQGD